jgi:tRNA pseudouridine38-40 synthase
VRVRLDLGYDGTDFSGWAKQPGRRTVEGVLDDALAMVFGLSSSPGLTVAGRTDAGVHARGQVAHSDLPSAAWTEHAERALHRLRGVLPTDVRVKSVALAPEGFDARFSATSRRYSYLLSDDPSGVDPTFRRTVVWHRRPLNVDDMNEAARVLLGDHDFAAFCKKREGASTIRTLRTFQWERRDDGVLNATVIADAFCHNMVRSLVGACVAVGERKHDASWISEVLAVRKRSSAVTVMPPHGLSLEEVTYPVDAKDLDTRAAQTRQVRH